VFAVLAMFSFNRVVRLPNTLLVSAIPMVLIAGVVVFMAQERAGRCTRSRCVRRGQLRDAARRRVGMDRAQRRSDRLLLAGGRARVRADVRLFPAALPGALGVVVPIAIVYIAVAWSLLLLSYAIEPSAFRARS